MDEITIETLLTRDTAKLLQFRILTHFIPHWTCACQSFLEFSTSCEITVGPILGNLILEQREDCRRGNLEEAADLDDRRDAAGRHATDVLQTSAGDARLEGFRLAGAEQGSFGAGEFVVDLVLQRVRDRITGVHNVVLDLLGTEARPEFCEPSGGLGRDELDRLAHHGIVGIGRPRGCCMLEGETARLRGGNCGEL